VAVKVMAKTKKAKRGAKKRARPEPEVGDLLAIALADGTFGLGHVLERRGNMIVVVVLTARAPSADALAALPPGKPIACVEVTGEDVRDGDWPIAGSRTCVYGPEIATSFGWSHSDNICEWIVSRWHGIHPYQCDDALLPGVYFPGVAPPPPPPTRGPGEIVITLDWADRRLRNTAKMQALHQVRDRILAEVPEGSSGCRSIEGRREGFGGGMLQAHFAVDAVEEALPRIEQMIAAWEHSGIASVEVRAIVPR
jgi:hypothetical protein